MHHNDPNPIASLAILILTTIVGLSIVILLGIVITDLILMLFAFGHLKLSQGKIFKHLRDKH